MVYTVKEIDDNWMDPDFKFFVNRGAPKKCMEFLMQNKNMKDEYLGACLDYIRWGGQETVMYELGTKGIINFIQQWMNLNENNLIWNEKAHSKNFSLSYIKLDKCPRDENHNRTIKDLSGRVRCAHKSEKGLKPSFVRSFNYFDKNSQVCVVNYWEDEPTDNLPDCAWDENTGKLLEDYEKEWEKYEEQMKKFKEEKPTFIFEDICYSILSDEKVVLSLEEVLDRLNLEPRTKTVYCRDRFSLCKRVDELKKSDKEAYKLTRRCPGHEEENNQTIHPFSGWKLTWYVQKWYEQFVDKQVLVFKK